jgi:uncharacterized protein involved in exopolysaccharide biosynthesis
MAFQEMLRILKKRFWLILVGAAVAGAVAVGLSLVWPPTYEAQALLLITKLRSDVTLDPRFQTVAEENVVNLSVQEEQVRRQTLVALARSSDLVQQVIDRLGDSLGPGERSVAAVASMADVTTEGNLITIAAKSGDPDKAAAVANAWADVYQENINLLYSATSPSEAQIQAQLQSAQETYEEAKTSVETFLRGSKENELIRQIDQKKQILADLQAAYLVGARKRMDELLARQSRIDRLVLDVQNLREQLAASPASDPLTPGEQFGLFSVEATAFAQADGPADSLQLDPGGLADGELTVGQARDHLARLNSTLQSAQASTQTQVDALSQGLLSSPELVAYGSGIQSAESIARMQADINALQSALEQERAAREDLIDTRGVAQENYLTLARKAAEVQIVSQLTGVEVQKASNARPPEEPTFPRPLLTTVLGVIAGGLVGLALAFVLELWPQGEKKPDKA